MTQVWQYTDNTDTVVSTVINGNVVSCLVTADPYLSSVAVGAETIAATSSPDVAKAIADSSYALALSDAKTLAAQGRTSDALAALISLMERTL